MKDSGTKRTSVSIEVNRGPRSCGVTCGEPDVGTDEREEVGDRRERLRGLIERLGIWLTADSKSLCVPFRHRAPGMMKRAGTIATSWKEHRRRTVECHFHCVPSFLRHLQLDFEFRYIARALRGHRYATGRSYRMK